MINIDWKEVETLNQMFSNFTEEFLAKKPCQIEAEELLQDIENNKKILIVDIKTQKEVMLIGFTHTDSIHIPMHTLFEKENLEKLANNHYEKIVLVCRSGQRSLVATAFLQRIGFKNIFSLQGGIIELVQHIRP